MKRILVVLAIVAAAAFVGASAAGASVAMSTFCINGNTYTIETGSSAAVDYTAAAAEGGFYFPTIDGDEDLAEIPFGFDFDEPLPSQIDSTTGLTLVPVSVGPCAPATPPQVDNVFLCYSTFSNVPAVFPAPVAAALLKGGGYWTPYAVPGKADGGTNIGGYHLVCNLASGQAAGSNTLGGAGEVDGANTKPDVTNVAGYYPIIGG